MLDRYGLDKITNNVPSGSADQCPRHKAQALYFRSVQDRGGFLNVEFKGPLGTAPTSNLLGPVSGLATLQSNTMVYLYGQTRQDIHKSHGYTLSFDNGGVLNPVYFACEASGAVNSAVPLGSQGAAIKPDYVTDLWVFLPDVEGSVFVMSVLSGLVLSWPRTGNEVLQQKLDPEVWQNPQIAISMLFTIDYINPPNERPTLSITTYNSNQLVGGSEAVITGSGYEPNTPYDIWFTNVPGKSVRSAFQLTNPGRLQSDQSGNISHTAIIGLDHVPASYGNVLMILEAPDGGVVATATLSPMNIERPLAKR